MPPSERYGLTVQMRRAANSIGANIAEGAGRRGTRDYANFLSYAIGSANETEHHITIAGDIGALPVEVCANLLNEIRDIRRMLHTLRKNLNEGTVTPSE